VLGRIPKDEILQDDLKASSLHIETFHLLIEGIYNEYHDIKESI
jgi:hypothetical protein